MVGLHAPVYCFLTDSYELKAIKTTHIRHLTVSVYEGCPCYLLGFLL
jgi:hypothetical protein